VERIHTEKKLTYFNFRPSFLLGLL